MAVTPPAGPQVQLNHRRAHGRGLAPEAGRSMSAYTSFFYAGARADLPASCAEVWVVLSGALRVGTGSDAVTVRAGDSVHVPEQTPGIVEAIEDTTMVCVSVPAH